MKYEKFDDWFWETENYSTRGDRFYEEFRNMTPERAFEWLKAAWECARMEECSYCSNPELSEVFFDQTCTGCVERMSEHARNLK
jgi:hypothetical protein